MKKIVIATTFAFGALTLVGAGCSKVETSEKMMKDAPASADAGKMMDDKNVKEGEGMMKDDTKKDEAMMTVPGQYVDYNASKLAMAAKGPVVLFFHATWCPSCKTTDADVMANLKDIPANFTILKVDYDSNPELKKRYSVTYQHTFVQVDANGNLIKKWSGSPSLTDIVDHTK